MSPLGAAAAGMWHCPRTRATEVSLGSTIINDKSEPSKDTSRIRQLQACLEGIRASYGVLGGRTQTGCMPGKHPSCRTVSANTDRDATPGWSKTEASAQASPDALERGNPCPGSLGLLAQV